MMKSLSIASIFAVLKVVYSDDGVFTIDYPSATVKAQSNGNITMQSGVHLNDVYIEPGPGGTVLLDDVDILQLIKIANSLPPVWKKHAHMGFFGTFIGEQKVNIKLEAVDPEDTNLNFQLVAGKLPFGIKLNNSTGYISGVIPDVDDIFSFTIRAVDQHGKYADAVFKMETKELDHCKSRSTCLHGGTCIDTKGWFNCSCPITYGGPRCELTCSSQSLGVGSRSIIPDAQMSAYLTFSTYAEKNGRYGASGYGWVGENNNAWLQVDLGNLTRIHEVRNQGYSSTYYTSAYTLSVSVDGENFYPVNRTNGGKYSFSSGTGNYQRALPTPVDARFVRFHPNGYHGHPSFKVELYGCHYQ